MLTGQMRLILGLWSADGLNRELIKTPAAFTSSLMNSAVPSIVCASQLYVVTWRLCVDVWSLVVSVSCFLCQPFIIWIYGTEGRPAPHHRQFFTPTSTACRGAAELVLQRTHPTLQPHWCSFLHTYSNLSKPTSLLCYHLCSSLLKLCIYSLVVQLSYFCRL